MSFFNVELLKLISIYVAAVVFLIIMVATLIQIKERYRFWLAKFITIVGFVFVLVFMVLSLYRLTVNFIELGVVDYFHKH